MSNVDVPKYVDLFHPPMNQDGLLGVYRALTGHDPDPEVLKKRDDKIRQ